MTRHCSPQAHMIQLLAFFSAAHHSFSVGLVCGLRNLFQSNGRRPLALLYVFLHFFIWR
jgi:hypothetical protein